MNLLLSLLLVSHDPLCWPRAQWVQQLEQNYAEVQIGQGLHNNDKIIELWVSEERETWTLLTTYPSGESCILYAGKYWRNIPQGDPL